MRDGGLATPASSLLDLSEYDGGSVINTYIVLVLRTFNTLIAQISMLNCLCLQIQILTE
jgi:hypothetical protein